MTPRPKVLGLAFVAPLLSGCFLFQPATPPGPTPEQIAAEEAAREQERQRKIEAERTDFVARVDAAKLAFDTTPSVATLDEYYRTVLTYNRLSEEARVGIDFDAYIEVIMTSTATMLEPLVASWAQKKERTIELRKKLKNLYSFRVDVLNLRKAPVEQYVPDGTTMLSLGPIVEDWKITEIGNTYQFDDDMLEAIEELGGRPAVHTICKAALDQAIAEDKKDVTRQHYIMDACVLWSDDADWQADLHAWATPKQTKAFIAEFGPFREQKIAENKADMARMEAEYHAQKAQEAEQEAQAAAEQSGGGGGSSSSSSSSGGGGSVSLTLRNTCGSTVKLWYGDDPKFGGGRSDSLGGNSRTSSSQKVGDMIWLTDDSRNGIASVTVSGTMREIEITCDGIRGK
jgi:uncharacterized membrane protein YgcG